MLLKFAIRKIYTGILENYIYHHYQHVVHVHVYKENDVWNHFFTTTGEIGKAPMAHQESLPVPETPDVPVSDEEEEEDMSSMRERLQALRS